MPPVDDGCEPSARGYGIPGLVSPPPQIIFRRSIAGIPDKIGGIATLPRAKEREALDAVLSSVKAIVLRGPSGSGKTVIAKRWAEEAVATHKVIWLDAGGGDLESLPTLQSRLGLSAPLRDIVAPVPDAHAVVVVDDMDLAHDLLLESVIFAADPLPLLERLWPDLAANDGQLLRRLDPALGPEIAKCAKHESLHSLAAAYGVSHETIRTIVRRMAGNEPAAAAA